ncbi:MAG: hypothetical protein EG828_11325 [Deltaproteobacteria bacterium]|nr:hypothetical protein [Deltaproteobacteria bacterium]
MSMKITVCVVASMVLMQVMGAEAATTGGPETVAPTATKPAATPTQIQKITAPVPLDRKLVRPAFTMTCPDSNDVTLHISSAMGGWVLTPNQLQPAGFSRAYASVDSADKTKVTLACLYQVTADYLAKTPYNGLQKCQCNPTTGEGKVSYTGPSGYTMNVVGTTAPGKLSVKKTAEQVQNQMLECQFHADGQAQFFKKYLAPANLSTCQVNGREVTCFY